MFKCTNCKWEGERYMVTSTGPLRGSSRYPRYSASPETYCPKCAGGEFTLEGEDVERKSSMFFARVPAISLVWVSIHAGNFPGAAEAKIEEIARGRGDDFSSMCNSKFIVQVKQNNTIRAFEVETEMAIECCASAVKAKAADEDK